MDLIHRCSVDRAEVTTTTGVGKKTEWKEIYRSVPCLFYAVSEREMIAGKAVEWDMHCLVRQADIQEGDRLTRRDAKTSPIWSVKKATLQEGIQSDIEGDSQHLHLYLATFK